MISRKHRFQGFRSLRFVYSKGKTVRGPLFSVKSARNPRRNDYRVAIVVGRKVDKSAVVRNRIRRRLYEAVRSLGPDIVEPHDIIITVFNGAVVDEPSQQLLTQLKKQLKAAGVLVNRIK